MKQSKLKTYLEFHDVQINAIAHKGHIVECLIKQSRHIELGSIFRRHAHGMPDPPSDQMLLGKE